MARNTLSSFLAVAALFSALLLSACEESISPIFENERNFTLFGTLDMQQDTQFVRVIPILPTLDPEERKPLDVTFVSTDLATGEERPWRDSLVTFDDGSYGHVFYSAFRVQPGRTYHIDVTELTSGRDEVTGVSTTVPPLPEPSVVAPHLSGGLSGGIASTAQQSIMWDGLLLTPFRIDVWYRFLISDRSPFTDIVLPYEPVDQPTGQGTVVQLDLRKDRLTLDSLIAVQDTPLFGVGMEVTVLDQNFRPPGGVFDPEILVQPGTLSNVENGFGFVGSVARFTVEWVLPDDDMRRLLYLPPADRFGKRAPEVRARIEREAIGRQRGYSGHHSSL